MSVTISGICSDCGDPSDRLWRNGTRNNPEDVGPLVCPSCYRKRSRKFIVDHRTEEQKVAERAYRTAWCRNHHRQQRADIIAHYGGACVCCGEDRLIFLVMDHVDGGGNAHRKSLGSTGKMQGSRSFYNWLAKNDCPEGFQVLCHNCNFAKSNGGCPHD